MTCCNAELAMGALWHADAAKAHRRERAGNARDDHAIGGPARRFERLGEQRL